MAEQKDLIFFYFIIFFFFSFETHSVSYLFLTVKKHFICWERLIAPERESESQQ